MIKNRNYTTSSKIVIEKKVVPLFPRLTLLSEKKKQKLWPELRP